MQGDGIRLLGHALKQLLSSNLRRRSILYEGFKFFLFLQATKALFLYTSLVKLIKICTWVVNQRWKVDLQYLLTTALWRLETKEESWATLIHNGPAEWDQRLIVGNLKSEQWQEWYE